MMLPTRLPATSILNTTNAPHTTIRLFVNFFNNRVDERAYWSNNDIMPANSRPVLCSKDGKLRYFIIVFWSSSNSDHLRFFTSSSTIVLVIVEIILESWLWSIVNWSRIHTFTVNRHIVIIRSWRRGRPCNTSIKGGRHLSSYRKKYSI